MTGKDLACSSVRSMKQSWRENLVGWAVDEPDRVRAYTGLALGAIGLAVVEAFAEQWLGCPTPPYPAPPPATAPASPQLVAFLARPLRRPLG
jgi:hypothetical protein